MPQKKFKIGQIVIGIDKINILCKGKIIKVNKNQYYVTFDEWTSKFNEWLSNSRIFPYNTNNEINNYINKDYKYYKKYMNSKKQNQKQSIIKHTRILYDKINIKHTKNDIIKTKYKKQYDTLIKYIKNPLLNISINEFNSLCSTNSENIKYIVSPNLNVTYHNTK